MTADEKTYSLQPCFGIEYEAGTLFCENCRDKKECWVKMETGCIPIAGRPEMKWKRILRASGLIEWQCEHGIGHPDAESAKQMGEGWGIHGCDGCCGRDDFPGKGKQAGDPK